MSDLTRVNEAIIFVKKLFALGYFFQDILRFKIAKIHRGLNHVELFFKTIFKKVYIQICDDIISVKKCKIPA